MDLLHLVDRLEELVASAQKMPIGSRSIIDRRRLLDVVDQMRVAIPQQVLEARELVTHREEHRLAAEEDARLIIARAEDQAARLVEDHELTRAARGRAEEIAQQTQSLIEERLQLANAEIDARIEESRRISGQQMEAADEYARELLARLDRQLNAFVRSVQSSLEQVQTAEHPEVAAPRPAAVAPTRMDEDDQASRADSGDPIWLHRDADRPDDPRRGEPDDDDEPRDAEFEDLLHRRGTPSASQPLPGAPGVIDDFSMPALDDQPKRLRDRERDREE